ncbi:hypothetical protein BIZ35_10140 [Heyndrickxia coagulans]|nr:hypothetical protein BIZ35_10140 [Heyndrickxia coagulans]
MLCSFFHVPVFPGCFRKKQGTSFFYLLTLFHLHSNIARNIIEVYPQAGEIMPCFGSHPNRV